MSGSVAATVAPSPSETRSAAGRRPGATLTNVAWIAEDDMDMGEWVNAGRRFGMINRCSAWWIGDWIRYGNAKFGEKYSRASTITGYDYGTLRNMCYIAAAFDVSRRRDTLTWSHHATLASMPLERQEYWLDQAAQHKLSVADLRLELRTRAKSHEKLPGSAEEADPVREPGGDEDAEPEDYVACPHCGKPIGRSLFTHLTA